MNIIINRESKIIKFYEWYYECELMLNSYPLRNMPKNMLDHLLDNLKIC